MEGFLYSPCDTVPTEEHVLKQPSWNNQAEALTHYQTDK